MPLLILFVVMPIVEMIVILKVASYIGGWSTIGLVVLTAVVGMALLRRQGLSTLMSAQQKMETGEMPLKEMVDGIFLAVGGALLLTPGFVTDTIGFCCLLPGIRQLLIGYVLRHVVSGVKVSVHTQSASYGAGQRKNSDIIDGEYHHCDQDDPDQNRLK